MNIFELMESCKNQYSSTDAQIYELIRKWPDDFSNKKINTIVKKFGVSQAALTRFAKRLGFDGFNVFQYQFRNDYSNLHQLQSSSSSSYYGEYLTEVEKAIKNKQLDTIISHILDCQNVILAGTNFSSLPAKYINYSMNFISIKPSFYFNPTNGNIPTTAKDVFILFSVNSGIMYKDYLKAIHASSDKPYTVLITLSKKHALGKYFDEVVVLPETHLSQTNRTVLPDTLAFFLFCDILIKNIGTASK